MPAMRTAAIFSLLVSTTPGLCVTAGAADEASPSPDSCFYDVQTLETTIEIFKDRGDLAGAMKRAAAVAEDATSCEKSQRPVNKRPMNLAAAESYAKAGDLAIGLGQPAEAVKFLTLSNQYFELVLSDPQTGSDEKMADRAQMSVNNDKLARIAAASASP